MKSIWYLFGFAIMKEETLVKIINEAQAQGYHNAQCDGTCK